MSSTTKKAGRPLTPNEKKTIIIAAICLAMAIILGVSLPLVLRQSAEEPTTETPSTPDSSLYISNGHFVYTDSESTTFPKVADDWKIYTYKAPEEGSDTHGFESVDVAEENASVIAGVVDVENWDTVLADLPDSLASTANPGLANDTDTDNNLYMFATKQATNAGIMSEYFTVGSQTSAKITINVNTAQLKDGSKAYVMIQNYSSTPSAKEDNRYAHTFQIEKQSGWQTVELYVFNRETYSKSVMCSIGIGNIYDNENAEGVLFFDNIDYTTVTANDYRVALDTEQAQDDSRYHIIGRDEIRDANEYVSLVNLDGTALTPYTSLSYLELDEAIVEGAAYSPFTKDETLSIYRIANDGTETEPVALKLDAWNGSPIIVKSDPNNANDHLHISFWVRVVQDNVLAKANILLQEMQLDASGNPVYVDGELVYKSDLSGGSFTSVITSQQIVEDNNCGWTKYDIYLKPTSAAATAVRVVFSLGNVNGYAQAPYTPSGTLFVTSPFVESISASTYSSASSGSYSKKVSLVGATASTSVTNGSFSSLSTSNPNQPTGWTPVFAGYNVIYKDGAGNQLPANLPNKLTDANGTVVRNAGSDAPLFDDSEANYLKIENNASTAFGYLSSDITLASKTVYAFTVLAKSTGDVNPYIYVVKNGAENRSQAVIGKIESKADADKLADDSKFGLLNFKEEESTWTSDGWTRYYIVIVTGESSETVRIALFNGSLDGSTTQQGTVCYDYVSMLTLGTYSIDTTEYEDDDEDKPATNRDRIDFTASSGYTVFEELTAQELTLLSDRNTYSNVSVHQPTDEEWNEMVENAMETTEDTTEEEEEDDNEINWALLTSVLSSVALVGALLIVVVIRMFKKRSKQ